MARALLLPLAILAGTTLSAATETPLPAEPQTLCISNESRLDADTALEFTRELTAIARGSGIDLRIVSCTADAVLFRVSVRRRSAIDASALGAARTTGSRVVPEFELYVDRIAELLPARLPKLMGRAMARVTAHELGHYFMQSRDHGRDSMTEFFTAARLMVNDPEFRIPKARHGSE
jgi:hypothetical protein